MKQQVIIDQLIDFDSLPNSAFLRLNQLISCGLIPFSANTVWRKVREGKFPTPVRISSQITAWKVSDIRNWQKDPSQYRHGRNL